MVNFRKAASHPDGTGHQAGSTGDFHQERPGKTLGERYHRYGIRSSEDGTIYVITEDGSEFDVHKESWSNIRYRYNETEKK